MMTISRLSIFLFGLMSILACEGVEFESQEELEAWFYDDSDTSSGRVSGGELVFVSPDKPETILHSRNQFTINTKSIDNGWVVLQQCYANLTPQKESQVVYQYKYMRKLTIVSSHQIGSSRVEGQTVQLNDIQSNAELCVNAEVRIFYQNPDKSFTLVSGPYHLKFLDGYYPMHLSFTVNFPAGQLQFTGLEPNHPQDMPAQFQAGQVSIDTYFEGKLTIKMNFKNLKNNQKK
ncbi:MAG: hypothetical protein OQK73_04950 [Gammaproteobacteria bacterium]|nr:hypothetical protein [Gammaproteobacteria bacterium]